jgi:tRNA-2-methylthio-N6-dimethylallyladenosine synthase
MGTQHAPDRYHGVVIHRDPSVVENGAGPTVYLETFGCQMNELDSELVRGQLVALGYRFIDDGSIADIVLYNTCSVREQAENKVLSRVGLMGKAKAAGSTQILGVIGCMAEREGPRMLSKYPQIDLLCGPGELDRLPMLLDNAMKTELVERSDRIALQGNRNRRTATLEAAQDRLELLDLSRAFDPDRAEAGGKSAYVRITRGCNKFCTYCVVPYTRGAEVHRPPDAIVGECKRLADQGVIEITLLGQTVNHYVYVHGAAVSADGLELPQIGPGAAAHRVRNLDPNRPAPSADSGQFTRGPTRRTTTFAALLRRIHDEVPAIERLRFVTSFPRDFGDDILHVMADSPRICRYLHVPAQSGSNRILKLMNRGYTVEQYLEFIDRARAILPDVEIAGDIIVGFPTETDEDFAMTRDLVERVRFKNNFIFKYSPRPGTSAIERHPDDVPDGVKRARNNELLALQARISAEVHQRYIGRCLEVFVEKISEREAKHRGNVELRWESSSVQLCGRTRGDLIVSFDAPPEPAARAFLGRIVPVEVVDAGSLILFGRYVARDLRAKPTAGLKLAPLAAPSGTCS